MQSHSGRRRRFGFTLIELLAALAISGLVLLGALLLLDQLGDSSVRIARNSAIIAREGNGIRLFRQLLLDARVTADTLDRFRGDERSAEFSTVCQRPGGWSEPCRATLAVDYRTDTSVIMAKLSTGEDLELVRHAGAAELRYFDLLAGDSAWAKRWAPSITLPGALGILVGADTIVYPLGPTRE